MFSRLRHGCGHEQQDQPRRPTATRPSTPSSTSGPTRRCRQRPAWGTDFFSGKMKADRERGVEGHQPRADDRHAGRGRHRAGVPDRRPQRPARPARLLSHALRDRGPGLREIPEALLRPRGHRSVRRHARREGVRRRRDEPRLHRRSPVPALVRAGARPREVLPVLRQVLGARRADPDAGRPVDDLREGFSLQERRPADHASTRWPATSRG